MSLLCLLFCGRYYDIVRDVRQNKGSILKASVEYIKKLKSDQHKKRLLEEKCRIQDSQNRKLLLKLQVIYFSAFCWANMVGLEGQMLMVSTLSVISGI